MLLEEYSSAVYWRISAIFSTIAALFSASIVIWFLIFRDNPDLPDDTDSNEKLRFKTDHKKHHHNLISELTHAFKHFPKLSTSSDSTPSTSKRPQNFFQRLMYFLFGSDSQNCSDLSEDISKTNL